MENIGTNIFDFSSPLNYLGKEINDTELKEWIQDAKVKEYPDTVYYAWPLQGITVVTKKYPKSENENDGFLIDSFFFYFNDKRYKPF